MNTDQNQLTELLEEVSSVLVVYPGNATTDVLAATAGVYTSLKAAGKAVSLASPAKPRVETAGFEVLSETQTEVGNQSLIVSFPYSEEAVDKVSYHISDDSSTFYLTIKPQAGALPLDASKLSYDYAGLEVDAIFLVGVSSLSSLGAVYEGYEDAYEKATIVQVGSTASNTAALTIKPDNAASLSETTAVALLNNQLPIPEEAATAFLRGIETQTQYFTSLSATAQTFETVASLLRLGARRSKPAQSNSGTSVQEQVVSRSPQPKRTIVSSGAELPVKQAKKLGSDS
ncbi:hypothetical protein KC686_03200 [Candidatus Woesebacteria bacterium]|nr:hypothetical protein [Candidatus Woesebacteria bacterium]